MGSLTILQLCQDAAVDLGLTSRPGTLFASDDNGDTSDIKLVRALTRVVKHLGATYDWQVLRREQQFLTVAQEGQAGAIPPDFLRFVPETFWDRTSKWRIAGPLPPSEWQEVKSWITAAVTPYFCQRGDTVLFYPVPGVNRLCTYEYVSTSIGAAAGSQAFTATSTKGSLTLAVTNTTGLATGMQLNGADVLPYSFITSVVTNTSITVNNPAIAGVTGGAYVATMPRTRFLADTDTTLWDDELITQGIVWKYREGERFDYAQDQQNFMILMQDRIKQDGGRRMIRMGGGRGNVAQDRINAMRSAAVVIKT